MIFEEKSTALPWFSTKQKLLLIT